MSANARIVLSLSAPVAGVVRNLSKGNSRAAGCLLRACTLEPGVDLTQKPRIARPRASRSRVTVDLPSWFLRGQERFARKLGMSVSRVAEIYLRQALCRPL